PARDRERPAPPGGARAPAAESARRRAGRDAAGPVLPRAAAARRVAAAGRGGRADAAPGAARRGKTASPASLAPGSPAARAVDGPGGADGAALRRRRAG